MDNHFQNKNNSIFLKVENMGAICSVGLDWYGLLYSWADSKKKSNWMLSIFEPGEFIIESDLY